MPENPIREFCDPCDPISAYVRHQLGTLTFDTATGRRDKEIRNRLWKYTEVEAYKQLLPDVIPRVDKRGDSKRSDVAGEGEEQRG